jgi:hypothetical protein
MQRSPGPKAYVLITLELLQALSRLSADRTQVANSAAAGYRIAGLEILRFGS